VKGLTLKFICSPFHIVASFKNPLKHKQWYVCHPFLLNKYASLEQKKAPIRGRASPEAHFWEYPPPPLFQGCLYFPKSRSLKVCTSICFANKDVDSTGHGTGNVSTLTVRLHFSSQLFPWQTLLGLLSILPRKDLLYWAQRSSLGQYYLKVVCDKLANEPEGKKFLKMWGGGGCTHKPFPCAGLFVFKHYPKAHC